MKYLFVIIFLFSVLVSFGQKEKERYTYSITKFINFLGHKGRRTVHELNYAHIKIDAKIEFNADSTSYEVVGEDSDICHVSFSSTGGYKLVATGISDIDFSNALISLNNCKIDDLAFYNCKFSKVFFEKNCIIENIYFYECTFETLYFDNCVIKKLSLNDCEGNKLTSNQNTFYSATKLTGKYDLVNFSSNKFIIDSVYLVTSSRWDPIPIYSFNEHYSPSSLSFKEGEFSKIDISGNSFEYIDQYDLIDKVYNYNFTGSIINELYMSGENIQRLNMNNASFESNIKFDSVIVNKDFSAMDVNFPEYNVNFSWKILMNKLNFFINDTTNYKALTSEEIKNEALYSSFITTYKKFFSVYKNKGDLESANACYVEMKDVETRRLKYLYETKGGSKYFLNYHLNRFLKYFAEYGTSPVRSVQISGWVILIFAFFYFFFYSAWDQINRKFLMERGDKLMAYFSSEQKLEELYSNKHKDDLFTFTQFKKRLKESESSVPFFFMLFLKPLYWVAVIKHKINKSLYKRVEFLQGKWVDLTAGKKFFLGTLTFLAILTYGVYLIAIRSLNSLILSINTFTTLGFGDIPVVGVSRYVAILEGFLGWFLLSIFSVSLISQILQN
jgi:uncharacterized protein YjbI with pentapeptide repeats